MGDKIAPQFVIFGGTFNPIHEGHLGLIRGLLDRGDVDHLFVVPASRNPFRQETRPLPADLRWEMLRLAVSPLAKVSVLDMELRRPQPSYTIDTVTALVSAYPWAKFKLAVGWDVYREFSGWHNPGAILERAGLLVILRRGEPVPAKHDHAGWLRGLPPEWRESVTLTENGEAVDRTGRKIVVFADLGLPDISGSRILAEHAAAHVPEAPRALLEAYWRSQAEE